MKKVFTLLMVALVCVSMTNCNRKIKNQLEELDERVSALEEIAKKQMPTSLLCKISSMQFRIMSL